MLSMSCLNCDCLYLKSRKYSLEEHIYKKMFYLPSDMNCHFRPSYHLESLAIAYMKAYPEENGQLSRLSKIESSIEYEYSRKLSTSRYGFLF